MKKEQLAKKALALHKKFRGKIGIEPKMHVRNRTDLSLVYTPGVAEVVARIAQTKSEARTYTMKRNTIAIVSDGSAVLGMGNVGPEAALPVMEGKALLFKELANVDAVPIVLDTSSLKLRSATTQEKIDFIVDTIVAIAPGFGGINLEDIAAPRCFEIETRLKKELSIPVMHDDQHGAAIVVLAGLINACKVVGKNVKTARIVVAGAGAAGYAVATLLHNYGATNILVVDREGIIHRRRPNLPAHKKRLAKITNPKNVRGTLQDALTGADVLVGVSGPGTVVRDDVRMMQKDAIVFALANPTPEIMPEEAKKGGAAVVATGRSDFPNQINNALVFPGIFRGALDCNVRDITEQIAIRAAKNLAHIVKKPTANKIIPGLFDKRVVKAVASAVR